MKNIENLIDDNISDCWRIFAENNSKTKFNKTEFATYCTSTSKDSTFNSILKISDSTYKENLEEIKQLYTKDGKSFSLWLPQPDIAKHEACILQNGLTFVTDILGLYLNLTDCDIEHVHDSNIKKIDVAELENWNKVVCQAFPIDHEGAEICSEAFGNFIKKPNGGYFVYYENSEPVSACSYYIYENNVVGIYNCGTLENSRGRGYMTKLLLALLKDLKDQKLEHVIVQSAQMSQQIFKKIGFKQVSSYNYYCFT